MARHSRGQNLRLVAGASTGGHLTELLLLLHHAPGLWPVMPCAYVTSKALGQTSLDRVGVPVHVLGEADRKRPLHALRVLLRAMRCAWQLRPDVVVTTGALPLALFCFWSRVFGARIVWIDSVAQVDTLSASGRFVRLFADLFLVQWPEIAERYRGVEYTGELF